MFSNTTFAVVFYISKLFCACCIAFIGFCLPLEAGTFFRGELEEFLDEYVSKPPYNPQRAREKVRAFLEQNQNQGSAVPLKYDPRGYWQLFTYLYFFGSTSYLLGEEQKRKEENALSLIENAIARIEAGTPLTGKQKMFIFWEIPSVEYPYFFELNHKDFRVQKLKKLIEKSPLFSKEEKALFRESTSPAARENAFENLAMHASVLPVLLPREDWEEEFKKYGPPWREQKEIMDSFVKSAQAYCAVVAEKKSSKRDLEESRVAYVRMYLSMLTLDPPKNTDEQKKARSYFCEKVCPWILRIRNREADLLEKDRNFATLIRKTNQAAGLVPVKDSYLMEYTILEEIRERIKKRNEKGK